MAFELRERLEAVKAVGLADAGVVHAAKRQVAVAVLHHAVVDAGAAGAGAAEHPLDVPLIPAPDVEGQRFGLGVDVGDDPVEVGIGADR